MKKLLVTLLLASVSLTGFSADNESEITVVPVAGDVYMLQGNGGNIGVLATSDGLLLVDDKFAPLAKQIEVAMKSIVDKPLKYIVNTHHHGDHTGSNSYFGAQAPIFAHENVRVRLSGNDKLTPEALPVITYKNGLSIFLKNEEIQLTHLPSGHTDGDSIVYFKKANVLHTGDLYFQIGFPFIDLKSGGSVNGYLANVNYMLENFPADVVIISGHGNVSNKAELKEYAQMLVDNIEMVTKALAAGKTEQEILTAGVAQKYKKKSWAFINEERFLKTLIADLQ